MMGSLTSLSTKQRLFVVSSIVLGTVLLSSAALSPTRARRQKEVSLPVLKDDTGSFRLVSLERIDDWLKIRMENTSKKTITAYGRAVCDYPESSTDYTIGDYPIQPGGTVEIMMPIRVITDKCDPAVTQATITINAVIFDDRTYGGEFRWAKGILDNRRGEKIQLKQVNRLLTKALKWPDAGEPAAIDRLKAQIESLTIDEGEAPAVRGGFSTARQTVSYLLDELKQWHQDSLAAQSVHNIPTRGELVGIKSLKEGIEKLISVNEKWISRY